MTTTTTCYGAELLDGGVRMNEILGYINSGEYTADQQDALSAALYDALRDEVDDLLPGGVTWQPATSSLLHPVGVEVPDEDEIREIFAAAWAAVEGRYEQIEAEVLGALPATVDELERALVAIASPVQRARVAGMLAANDTARMAARVRGEAIWEATRERGSAALVAERLGTGEAAIRKVIKERNQRNSGI